MQRCIFLLHQESCTKEIISKSLTLPETNSSPPENRPSQEETSIPTIHFQVRAVSLGRVSTCENESFSCPGLCKVDDEEAVKEALRSISVSDFRF